MEEKKLEINQETMDILVTNVIPTSKYFEIRFDNIEQKFDYKIERIETELSSISKQVQNLQTDVDKRFEKIDERFARIDEKFEKIDEKFDLMQKENNKRFERIDEKFDKLMEKIDTKIDSGLKENRIQSFRLFSFAMTFSAISLVGLFGKIFGLI
jgi:Skp family chaperone for outer membrane proteins